MMKSLDELAQQFWAASNLRDWPALTAMLHPDMVYRVPQTREQVRGREGFVDFFATWPGQWRVYVLQVLADAGRSQVLTRARFTPNVQEVGGEEQALTWFTVQDGLITQIDEFWPADYEPPPRHSRHVERW